MVRTKDEIRDYNEKYYIKNIDKILDRKREYYAKNRAEVICECGKLLQHRSVRLHLRSKMHLEFIQTQKK
jgi:hypothetical protein